MLHAFDALVFAALAIAAASDIASRRIPNVLVLTVGLLGLTVSAGSHQLLSGVAAAIASLCLGVPMWRRGLVGGGDVKLAAATAAWVRLDQMVAFVLVVALCGGLLSLVALLRASAAERRLVRANATASLATSRIMVARSAGTSIPYGVAIAVGAGLVMSGVLS
jgi:prepilin peptidase CpaA